MESLKLRRIEESGVEDFESVKLKEKSKNQRNAIVLLGFRCYRLERNEERKMKEIAGKNFTETTKGVKYKKRKRKREVSERYSISENEMQGKGFIVHSFIGAKMGQVSSLKTKFSFFLSYFLFVSVFNFKKTI